MVKSWTEETYFHVITLRQRTFTLRRPRVAIFAEVIKTANILKKPLKTQKSEKNYKLCMKMRCISVFPDIIKVPDFQ